VGPKLAKLNVDRIAAGGKGHIEVDRKEIPGPEQVTMVTTVHFLGKKKICTGNGTLKTNPFGTTRESNHRKCLCVCF